MSDSIPIPVHIAQQISSQYQKSMVVILAYEPHTDLTHAVSYGVNAQEKQIAATISEECMKLIGGDLSQKESFEDFRTDLDPALYREAAEILISLKNSQSLTHAMLADIHVWVDNYKKSCAEKKNQEK